MSPLLLGVVAVAFLWWLGKYYAQADPKKLAAVLRKTGGITAMAVAALLLARGRFDMALPLAGFGWWLFDGRWVSLPNFGWGAGKSPGMRSRVRSAMIEMELDHDSGALRGRVLAGPLAGRELDSLDQAGLIALLGECAPVDPDGARLLEAYLDRRFARWREDAQGHAYAGAGSQPGPGAMTEKEAYEVLGLQAGAGDDDIRRAHRALMKKLHPDQGGSTYLATRVNQAKEVLLNRHR